MSQGQLDLAVETERVCPTCLGAHASDAEEDACIEDGRGPLHEAIAISVDDPATNRKRLILVRFEESESGITSGGGAREKEKTSCPKGHPYDEQNTRWTKRGRICRKCETERSRARWRQEQAERAVARETPRENPLPVEAAGPQYVVIAKGIESGRSYREIGELLNLPVQRIYRMASSARRLGYAMPYARTPQSEED